jgi:RHH-type proline utilization regulon transcriptional repressor/proline dehydrogenase/delta 1-pyrroline-5-carboxylate dehydrogenase
LRLLYVQEDIADDLVRMLREAAAMMTIGNPSRTSTDIGPVIDQDAKAQIDEYVARAAREGRLIWQGVAPQTGCFCPPSMLSVKGIADLETEIFGPVLHVATYRAGSESAVVDAINRSGYGLTFGMHSRIDANIEAVCAAINVGNVYINRNQIGAVVGSQPFGGHGLSGTGPKAGGPLYLAAFLQKAGTQRVGTPEEISLPSPSGERNTYSVTALGKKVLVLHADSKTRQSLATIAASFGNEVEMVSAVPDDLTDIDAVITQSVDTAEACALRQALCRVSNRVIPVITDDAGYVWLQKEKHLCRDMTASGGNVDLLMK